MMNIQHITNYFFRIPFIPLSYDSIENYIKYIMTSDVNFHFKRDI